MKKLLIFMAAILGSAAVAQAGDVVSTREGKELTLNFFGHGSVGFEYAGMQIYVDPVSDYANYAALPKADLILVTHEHSDHLDPKAIAALSKAGTVILGNKTAIDELNKGVSSRGPGGDERGEVLSHGERREITFGGPTDGAAGGATGNSAGGRAGGERIIVEAVAAYNTSPEKANFHPWARSNNGYVITFGGTRVYVAGDTEPTPELLALAGIDIAFLPVNLPYTMTERQAATVAKALNANRYGRSGSLVFYPYHFGGTSHHTDLAKLADLLAGSGIDMRVRKLE